MKTKLILAILAVMAALCAAPAWAQMTTVKGRVTDDGTGLPGIVVEFTNQENGRKFTYKTDKNGNYFSIGISGGIYNVKVIKDGQLVTQTTNFQVSLAKEENVLDFDLAKERKKAENTVSEEEKQRRAAIAKENEKITGLNQLLAASNQATQSGNYDEAVRLMTQATQADPGRDLLWAKLGDALLASGKHKPVTDRAAAQEDYGKAIDAYKKAIEIKPTIGPYYNNLGEAYARTGKTQDAIAQYQLAAQNDPTDAAKYYFNLGAVLTNNGKVDDANTAFDKAIAANPNYAEAYYQKAVNLMGKATVDEKTGTMKVPPDVPNNLNKYLELSPNGPNAAAAKELLTSLGAKIETSFGKGKATTKKK